MRTTNMLLEGFENIKTLQQYLYMDEDNAVIVHNAIGVPLRIRMTEDGVYMCQNMNFPDLPESNWSEEMTINKTLAVIEALKEEPAGAFPKRFKNRWEEVKEITQMNVGLNINKRR